MKHLSISHFGLTSLCARSDNSSKVVDDNKRINKLTLIDNNVTKSNEGIASVNSPENINKKYTISRMITKHQSKAVTGAKAFIDIQNKGIYNKLIDVASPRCLFQFESAEFLLDTWIEDAGKIGSSYPDFHLSYERIIDISPTQAMIVNLQASGTHTGTPYGFGPYPEIPATGLHCKNDFEDVTVTIDPVSGMIICMSFVAKGPMTGPPGFYDQIGGIF
jgi:hypothetical protein